MKALKILALLALLPCSFLRAEEPVQPFWSGTLGMIRDYGLAPLQWRTPHWGLAAEAGMALAVVWNNDGQLYQQWALGSARHDWQDRTMPVLSGLGEGWVEALGAAAAAEFGPPRLARTSAVALQALAVSAVYTEVFKYAAWSNRPSQDESQHKLWYYSQPTQGMPSGHSFSAFAAAEVYGAEYGRWWTYPLAGLVAYSRIYNQAHWPSDVLAGSILGVSAGILARHQAEVLGSPRFLRLGLTTSPDGQTPMALARIPY
jgi:membrane-associated phospholipid phosphatase